MSKLITTVLSTQTLKYKPGSTASFDVVVTNNSTEFSAFQLEVAASGVEAQSNHWYRLAPDVSAKIPGAIAPSLQSRLSMYRLCRVGLPER